MLSTKLKLLRETDDVVIGNTVEAVMFAMLNNFDYIHSSIRAYRWFESMPALGTLGDLNSLYSSLFLYWHARGGTLFDFSDKRIEFRGDRIVEVRTADLDESFYVKFQRLHLFDDLNVFNIPGTLSEERKYRVYDTVTSRQFVDIIDEPIIVTTGQYFPRLICLADNEMRREIARGYEKFSEKETNYQKWTYNVCMAYSELTAKELKSIDKFQVKNLKFFMQDFMRYYGANTKTMSFPIRQIESIVGKYDCWNNFVRFYSDKGELSTVWNSFWEKFFDFEETEYIISGYRKVFPVKHFVHDYLEKCGLDVTAGRIDKEDDTKASSKISEVIRGSGWSDARPRN